MRTDAAFYDVYDQTTASLPYVDNGKMRPQVSAILSLQFGVSQPDAYDNPRFLVARLSTANSWALAQGISESPLAYACFARRFAPGSVRLVHIRNRRLGRGADLTLLGNPSAHDILFPKVLRRCFDDNSRGRQALLLPHPTSSDHPR